MKRYFLYSILLVFFYGCEEVIPEYSPLYGEPTIESQIRYPEILSVADDGTVWAISEGSDDCKHIYWIKEGLIKSQPELECSHYIEFYGTIGENFYYFQRRWLIIHNPDSVKVLEMPVSGDDCSFELYFTETLVVLLKMDSQPRYWLLSGDDWIQKSISVELKEGLWNALQNGRFRNEYTLCYNWNTLENVIFNLATGEYITIDPTYTDEYGNEHSLDINYYAEPNCFDQQGNIYVVSAYDELFRVNRAIHSVEIIPVSIPGVDNNEIQIKRVVVSANDNIWVAFINTSTYDYGIYMIGSNSSHYLDDMDLSSTKLFADSNGRLWTYYWGIKVYDQNGLVTEYEVDLDFEYFIKEDDSGAVWFGHINSGIFRFAEGSWTSYNQFFNTDGFWGK